MKKIIVASDRAGFTLKEAVKEHLVELGYEVTDVGSKDTGEGGMAYWQAAKNLAPRVSSGEFERGILVCGTGMGMSIAGRECALLRNWKFVRLCASAASRRHR